MTRPANPPEVRTLRALRQVDAITGDQFIEAVALLEATEPCTRCGGSGIDPEPANEPSGPVDVPCRRCDGTGEQYVIR